jgi:hypothetical protein
MHISVQKKCWNEVLKSTLYQYIKSLLTTASKKVKKVEELTSKLRYDKETLIGAYQKLLGEYLTRETLKILDDFLEFLDVSPMMISVSCTKLREFNGPSFSVATAKALINLRCDLSKDEKNEAINSCKEVLESFSKNEGNNKASGFFENLENDIKFQEREEMDDSQLEEIEESQSLNIVSMNLADFLNTGGDESQLDEKETFEDRSEIKRGSFISNFGDQFVSDVVVEGLMKKKTYSMYLFN